MNALDRRIKKDALIYAQQVFADWAKECPKDRAEIEWIHGALKMDRLDAEQLRAVESLVNRVQPATGDVGKVAEVPVLAIERKILYNPGGAAVMDCPKCGMRHYRLLPNPWGCKEFCVHCSSGSELVLVYEEEDA